MPTGGGPSHPRPLSQAGHRNRRHPCSMSDPSNHPPAGEEPTAREAAAPAEPVTAPAEPVAPQTPPASGPVPPPTPPPPAPAAPPGGGWGPQPPPGSAWLRPGYRRH